MKRLESLKKEICQYSHLAYQRGLASGTGGNISIRTSDADDIFLITPAGISLRWIVTEQIITVNRNCEKISGPVQYKPSKETSMHLTIYNHYPHINAVIHLHPPYCIACSLIKKTIPLVTVQSERNLKVVSSIPKAYPGSKELVGHLSRKLKEIDQNTKLIVLVEHGVIALEENLESAFNTVDLAEETAKVTFISEGIGR